MHYLSLSLQLGPQCTSAVPAPFVLLCRLASLSLRDGGALFQHLKEVIAPRFSSLSCSCSLSPFFFTSPYILSFTHFILPSFYPLSPSLFFTVCFTVASHSGLPLSLFPTLFSLSSSLLLFAFCSLSLFHPSFLSHSAPFPSSPSLWCFVSLTLFFIIPLSTSSERLCLCLSSGALCPPTPVRSLAPVQHRSHTQRPSVASEPGAPAAAVPPYHVPRGALQFVTIQ